MQGLYLAQQAHIVNVLPPRDVSGGATGDRFKMRNHGHASILVSIGASAVAPTSIKLYEADADSGGTKAAIAFDYYAETTADGDTLGAKQSATSDGITSVTANDNTLYVIELDARQLSDGDFWVELEINCESGQVVLASAVAVLSGARFAGDQSATAIA